MVSVWLAIFVDTIGLLRPWPPPAGPVPHRPRLSDGKGGLVFSGGQDHAAAPPAAGDQQGNSASLPPTQARCTRLHSLRHD